ncbi:hypothetical protein LX15_000361 [Streptoalloteichus tenebrarius]|uniref:Uncharacterized protein n=1 Tax=Streptoalloteichus tenebrarius (strain ATCC 17920 / DSM 40477 / JCM 4838 / CBS 697.72 / NBRC 16177 / NCIMB 11028 / NRRL B-12390 / A12253. 1 / ISP 5477) TaxID=1933 RepID=A0ABT1HME8_STRSD|nr:hypothetical protein [Streptoalloteichus tenebrarius]MCP2256678.1 hypothetical protein [Streptoalloteichus tenebrarius]BFF00423.1 hypothetical protein GCM10020241_20980 [Streptoalloteichus tenebrarius]
MGWSGRLGWSEWVELARAGRAAPRWQLVVAGVVSALWSCWMIDQVGAGRSPLGVLRAGLVWADLPADWLDQARAWLAAPHRRPVVDAAAWAVGGLWAATHRRRVLPAVVGWLVLLTVADALGYAVAARHAGFGFAVVVGVLLLLSVPLRRRPMGRGVRLYPKDVFVAAARAAALTILVPLSAPLLVVAALCDPYLTVPPRRLPVRLPLPRPRADADADVPARRDPERQADPRSQRP